jgi:type IV pilus assembly protein PilA
MKKLNETLKKKTGFTLIELMIVVAIIGILAAIAIPNFLRFQAKAKQSEARVLLSGIYTAEVAYFAEQNEYSPDLVRAVGFAPSSTPKYYTHVASGAGSTNDYLINATTTSFSAQASGNLDGDAFRDIWTVTHDNREPQMLSNDVVLP